MTGRLFGGLAVGLGVLIVASCGSTSTSTSSPPPSARTVTTPTPNPQEAVVIRAYLAQQKAFDDAKASSDIASPALAATTIDPALHALRLKLVTWQLNGIVGRGSHQYHPRVESLTPTTAVVVDCFYSEGILVYQKTGIPVPNQPGGTQPEWNLFHATLMQVSPGVWKVSDSTVKLGQCLPGS